MKLPVMSIVLIVIGIAAIVFGFIYGSIKSIENIEGKIEETRMSKVEVRVSSSSKNHSGSSTRMDPVLVISTSGGEVYVRDAYDEYWKELQDKSLIGKNISVSYEKSGFMIKELLIDGKIIINDDVVNKGNDTFRYFFFMFGAVAFYMAWQFYNKKKMRAANS